MANESNLKPLTTERARDIEKKVVKHMQGT